MFTFATSQTNYQSGMPMQTSKPTDRNGLESYFKTQLAFNMFHPGAFYTDSNFKSLETVGLQDKFQIIGLIRLETFHTKLVDCGGPGVYKYCYKTTDKNDQDIYNENISDESWGLYRNNFGVSDKPIALERVTFPFKGY